MKTVERIPFEIKPKFEQIVSDKIEHLLTEIVETNSKGAYNSEDPFSRKSIPEISVGDYLERIKKYTKLEKSTLIIAMIYIDRICNQNRIQLTQYNIHRILLGTCLTAIKYNEDNIFNNLYYSKVAGVSLKEMNFIESITLSFLNFRLYVDDKTFEFYTNSLASI